MPLTAQMTCESQQRESQWLMHGCNGFDMKSPISNPMSFWTEQDVLQYIKENNIPIASVYGDIVYEDYDGQTRLEGCGKRKTDGEHSTCTVCRVKKAAEQREYNRKQGMMPIELRGYGYCTICYTPTENKVCEACHARLVEHAAMMRKKQSLKHHVWQKYNANDVQRVRYRQTNGEHAQSGFEG